MESKQLFFLIFSLTFFSYIQSSSFSLSTWASSLFEEPPKEKRYIPIDQIGQAESSDQPDIQFQEEEGFVLIEKSKLPDFQKLLNDQSPLAQGNKPTRFVLLKIALYLNGCACAHTSIQFFNEETNMYTVMYKQIATGFLYEAVFTNKGVLHSVMDQNAVNLGAFCLDDDN